MSNQPTSAEASGRDVTPSANRRTWGIYDNESDNTNRSSGGGSGAGSWIRSVFSSSPSGGRRAGEKPPADVSPRPRSIDPGPRRGNLSAKSSSSVAEETTVAAPAGTIPDGDDDANRLRDVTGTTTEEGTTPVPHGSVEGRLAPQVCFACTLVRACRLTIGQKGLFIGEETSRAFSACRIHSVERKTSSRCNDIGRYFEKVTGEAKRRFDHSLLLSWLKENPVLEGGGTLMFFMP